MKGLAVTQIIMLVLGIIVLAVIGFLLYTNFLAAGGQLDSSKCLAIATDQCRIAQVAGGISWDGLTVLSIPGCSDANGNCIFDRALKCDGSPTEANCARIVGGTFGGAETTGGGGGSGEVVTDTGGEQITDIIGGN